MIYQLKKLRPYSYKMKLQKFVIYSLILCVFSLAGCSKDDESLKEVEVVLDSYKFTFPQGFKYVTQLYADYWVGSVSNDKMIFHFEHGLYVYPPNDVPGDHNEVTEEDFEGRYLRIARPRDSQNGWTSIYISSVKEVPEDDLHWGLHMRVTNLTPEEQELAITIFRSLTIVPKN